MPREPLRGEEVEVGQMQDWSALSPLKGQIIEVYLARSNFKDPVAHWAAFLILKVSTWMDGSLCLECKHLGCTDETLNPELDAAFNQGPYFIHLCL